MEGFSQENKFADNFDKKPTGYKAITYAPKIKVDSESSLLKLEQTMLQRPYTFWLMIREQDFKNKKKDAYNLDDLQDITSFDSVSI